MRRAVASGKDSWHNRWSDCQTLYQYQLHYLKNKKNKFKVRRQFERGNKILNFKQANEICHKKCFQPSFPKTLAWLNSSLLYSCSALSSVITIVSECYQMGFCFHVSFFITLPFLSCKGLTLQVIDWPATPTVAAPAPMNLAAESTSCTWELVWKPRQATDNMGEEGKAWKKKKKRKIYQQIQSLYQKSIVYMYCCTYSCQNG